MFDERRIMIHSLTHRIGMAVGVALLGLVAVGWSLRAQSPAPPRMGPIPAEAMTDAQVKAAKEVERNGAVQGYLWPMLRDPGLARPTQDLATFINRDSKLPKKLTQLTIIYVSRRLMYNGSWAEHVEVAQRQGLRPEIAQAIAADQRPTNLDQDEQIVYDMCMELDHTMTISDATYARAVARLGEAGVVDTVATYGYYAYLGLFNNATHLPPGVAPAFHPPAR
jgi:4-carboxymuconolactone decarboxylase